MSSNDGQILGVVKIEDNGSPAARYDLVLVGEGYTQSEQAKYGQDAADFVQHMFAEPPFNQLRRAFNVYRVDVVSTDSGADDPAACGGSGAAPATYFDASFCSQGIRRLLSVDEALVQDVVQQRIPEWDKVLVLVNSPIWGGSGGKVATTSTAQGWEDMALHEMGHSLFGLADEYDYWKSCQGDDPYFDQFTSWEPQEANVTVGTTRNTIKWSAAILQDAHIQATRNPNCRHCDLQPSPYPPGTVGTFEGAGNYHCGIYRPQHDCKMRHLSAPFCAICQQRIREQLAIYLPSLS